MRDYCSGVLTGFIDEHDVADPRRVRLQPGLAFAPHRSGRLHIGPLLFAGVCGFF
ncbi:MAG: hypothetical protein ACI9JL_003404 [Paracoccaceae bacterium]|jgi:hypothetical protein